MNFPFSLNTDLGLIGLTISSLTTLLAYVIVSNNKREDRRSEGFQKTISEIHTMHKNERIEWKTDANRREEQTSKAICQLSSAINKISVNIAPI